MAGHQSIELTEFKKWTSNRSSRRRRGYTPPEFLPRPALVPTGTDGNALSPGQGYSTLSTNFGSPSVSTMTSDDPFPTAKELPRTLQGQAEFSGRRKGYTEKSGSHQRTAGDIDVITAQIRRALGFNDGASDIPDDETVTDDFYDSEPTQLSSWQSQTHEEMFRACIIGPTVDVDELRRIIWAHGVPDRPWARPLAWKLLVGYLPPDRVDWDNELATRRAEYWTLVSHLTVDPRDFTTGSDHPLNDAEDSLWGEHFRDTELRAVIQKDVDRTHPDIHRFARLRECLQRILFVFAKRNPSLAYRQGMNELLAPLMLVFADGPFEDLSDAEADAYFCFASIMREMSVCYLPQEDSSNAGVSKQLRELQALLRIKDPRLEHHLTECGVDIRFFGLRWLRLWLSQEFEIPDCLRIWDSLLTAEVTLPWLRYVCVAMIIRIRDSLLAADFAGCMKLLLHYPPCDVAELLRVGDRLRTTNVVIVRAARR